MNDSNVVGEVKLLAHHILEFIERSPWRDSYAERIKVLSERADYPCELAIVGQVKAGKSSFLNAFLGEKLAMVGTTETTATINFFKYGLREDENLPVKVIWEDGTEEWQTREFLDSLQGNSPEVIKKAEKIDHLEYYLPNKVLQGITLVDTPGTNALVDAHNQRANEYILNDNKLREKHHAQSVNLKNKADAVIVITERVPKDDTNKLVSSLSQETEAFNALGVITKIDLERDTNADDWKRRCTEYSNLLRHQLNTIVPVSSNVYDTVRRLQKENKLEYLQEMIRCIPNDKFSRLFNGEYYKFLGDPNDPDPNKRSPVSDKKLTEYGLSYPIRKEMAEGMDWTVFVRIMKSLYYLSIEDAVKELTEYSGMDQLKKIIDKQFINRSRIIRCSKIVSELRNILTEIRDRRIYSIRRAAKNKQKYLDIINNSNSEEWIKSDFLNFVNENICTKEQYDDYEIKIRELIEETETLKLSYEIKNKKIEGLYLLEKTHKYFSESEIEELELLFGKRIGETVSLNRNYIAGRYSFWQARRPSAYNNDVKRIIELSIFAYGSIKTE